MENLYNAQPEILATLKELKSVSNIVISQGIPDQFEAIPTITYEESATGDDESQWNTETAWTINIFTKTSSDRTKIKLELYQLMQSKGWHCSLSQGLKDPSKYYRQIMRFKKTYNKLSKISYSS